MFPRQWLALVAILPLPLAATAQTPSRVSIRGTSNLRAYECSSLRPELRLHLAADSARDVEGVIRSADSVDVQVPVASLMCASGAVESELRKALGPSKDAVVRFEGRIPRALGNGAVIDGDLTIAGTRRPVELSGLVSLVGDGVHVRGEKSIRMSDWGVRPPRALLGVIRAEDQVTVAFDVYFPR